MTNSLGQDIYNVGELMAENLTTMGVDQATADDGLTTLAGKILDIVTPTESASLSINVPLNIVYGDDFNITGVLTDSSDNPISDMTIQLLVGNTPVATATTDSNGSVSFTRSPVSMGTHTFQLHFNGSGNYPATSSSTVSRNVDKETSVISVSVPVDNSSIYSDESVSISGVLTDDDGEAISSASILVQDGGSTVNTLTTGADGSFTGSISGLSVGSHTLGFVFETTDYYTASSVSRTVAVNTPTLTLSADNQLLSYADSDEVTFTAVYVGGVLSGKTVTFYKSSDDSVLGTGTTNASGVATCGTTYQSAGVGDVGFYAVCGTLYSDTYDVEDCDRYDNASTDKSSEYTKTSSLSVTHDTDHYVFKSSSGNQFLTFGSGYDNISFECDLKLQSSTNINGLCVSDYQSSLNQALILELSNLRYRVSTVDGYNTYNSRYTVSEQPSHDEYYHLSIEISGNSLHCEVLYGETVKLDYTYTKSIDNKYLSVFGSNSGTIYHVKNIKIKPL